MLDLSLGAIQHGAARVQQGSVYQSAQREQASSVPSFSSCDRSAPSMNPLSRGRRVAITGTFGAGKSVFLLSLLHHLHQLDPTRFRLGEKRGEPVQLKGVRSLDVPSYQRFPYPEAAKRLIQPGGGVWPGRVHSVQRYGVKFRRTGRLSADQLHFMSFPLERLMDLNIARTEVYVDWADRTLLKIDEDPQASRQARQFMQHLDAPELQPERLVTAYKHALTQFVFDYQPFAAPSTFMIDLEGNRIEGGLPKVVSQGRYVGLPPHEGRPAAEFIPLSGVTRMRAPELVTQHAQHYERYRQELALPLFKELTGCDTLVVLIDIPSLLSGGRAAFKEQLFLLSELKRLLKLKVRGGQQLGRSKTTRVALVATKIDLVRTFERDARLPSLLRQLGDEFLEDLHPSIEVGRFVCSPCVATRPHNSDPNSLIGRMMHASRNPERIERPFAVPETPRFWPEKYRPSDFPFVKVWPPVLQAHEKLPNHIRLDDVCRFLLG